MEQLSDLLLAHPELLPRSLNGATWKRHSFGCWPSLTHPCLYSRGGKHFYFFVLFTCRPYVWQVNLRNSPVKNSFSIELCWRHQVSDSENVKMITDRRRGYFHTQLSWETTDLGGGFHVLATIWKSRTSRYLDDSLRLEHFSSLNNYSNTLSYKNWNIAILQN